MLIIELLVPKDVFSEEQRREMATRLTARRLLSGAGTEAGVDAGVLDWYESLTHVVVREPDVWIADGVPATGPRYLVNVYVGAWGKEMSEHLISRITQELAAGEDDPQRLFREPHALVNVIGIAEGSYGLFGRVQRSTDALAMIEKAKEPAPAEVPPGMVLDPVCGAVLPLEDAVTLERDGETFAFCCSHCRGHFAKRQRLHA
ncbi:YHS domain protein [Nonomuraea sp. B12E4]|uniref:YHS domain protein n=1 Tax=Nonomuraea sp. B12E4 TaxID=3153564 RepID=UPI00325EB2E8